MVQRVGPFRGGGPRRVQRPVRQIQDVLPSRETERHFPVEGAQPRRYIDVVDLLATGLRCHGQGRGPETRTREFEVPARHVLDVAIERQPPAKGAAVRLLLRRLPAPQRHNRGIRAGRAERRHRRAGAIEGQAGVGRAGDGTCIPIAPDAERIAGPGLRGIREPAHARAARNSRVRALRSVGHDRPPAPRCGKNPIRNPPG